ncbi:TonB-dependent receptor [Flavobacterium alkalisoli]|uniref:TonB-dependent receptor n=1 Tax=Flavobacterium alkalisoli TaxID=2602769 RepID=A0A5B9FYA1_9FLAO|nr:TonB-dependent receptor [Flavobacterium alkalisoli]QEE51006.1 TonB-dependent receptor [Flavobacterium alkalisoli]
MKHIFSSCFLVLSLSLFAQEVSLSLDQTATLKEIFNQIEAQTDYKFAFTDQINTDQRYLKEPLRLQNVTVQELLTRMEKQLPLHFTVIGNNITVKQHSNYESSQNYTLTGTITDVSGGPLPGATIYIRETQAAVSTDVNGKYILRLPSGSYTIIVQYLGFKNIERTLRVSGNTSSNFTLEEDMQNLKEVVITQNNKATDIRKPQMSINSLTMQEIKRIPAAMGEPDPIKSLMTLPGVTNAGEGSSGFNVRGGAADQNLVLLDGAPIYNDSHMFGFFSVFNADAVKSLDLYKGGIPAAFGGRVSSVLDVHQQQGRGDSLKVNGGIGLISSRLMVEGPVKKDLGSFMLAGRASYAHLFLKLANNSNSASFYDLNGRFNYKVGKKSSLHFSGYLGNDVFDIGNRFASTYGNTMGNIYWNYKLSEAIDTRLSLYYSDYKFNLSIASENFNWDSAVKTYGLKYNWQQRLSEKFNLNYGVEATYYDFNPGTLKPEGGDSSFNFQQLDKKYALEPAAYLDIEHKITEKLNLRYGFRYSMFYRYGAEEISTYADNKAVVYNPLYDIYQEAVPTGSVSYGRGEKIAGFENFEPRASLSYILSDDNSLKASYNRMAQYIHILTNTQSPLPMNIWTPSGPFIEPQLLDQYALGYFRNFKNKEYSLETEVFYKTIRNRVDYIDGADILGNNNMERVILNGKARSYGLELLLRKNTGRLTGWLAYTLSKAEQKTSGRTPEEPGIANGEWYLSPYDKLHNLNITGNYEWSPKWSFSANFTLQSGRPVTFPDGYYEFGNIHVPNFPARNQNRLPAYHHLDLAATYTPKPDKQRGWQSYWVFSIYNVYARKNAASIQFGTNEDTGMNQATRLSIFGIIPSVSYNFKF